MEREGTNQQNCSVDGSSKGIGILQGSKQSKSSRFFSSFFGRVIRETKILCIMQVRVSVSGGGKI